jgi:hypothetical protein
MRDKLTSDETYDIFYLWVYGSIDGTADTAYQHKARLAVFLLRILNKRKPHER